MSDQHSHMWRNEAAPPSDTVGIVLAGGGATRLASVAEVTRGGKAAVVFRGRTFVEHVVAAVAAGVHDTIVVAAAGQPLPALARAQIVTDSAPGAGPLAGIRDGLAAARAAAERRNGPPPRFAFVASCDLPLLRPEVVRLLVEAARRSDALWTVPLVHGHRQVLVSVMRVELLPRIEAWLATGRRDLRGLLTALAEEDARSVREVTEVELSAADPGLESFVDIDTPEDLERLQSR
ncbi:MAG: molybdenum cofactor guanylyltransferase [Planctomycetia bacterium]